MSLTILQIIGVVIFCVFGFQRGWKREFILLAAIILGVVFLSLNGGAALAWILFVGLPFLFSSLGQKTAKAVVLPTSADTTAVIITTLLSFILILAIGYLIGERMVDKPAKPVDNFLGLIPATISGYIVATYILGNTPIANFPLFSTQLLKIDLTLPNFLLLTVIGVVVVAIALIAGNARKGAPKESKK